MIPVRFEIITIFPEYFIQFKSIGTIGRAIENGLIQINTHNPRDYSKDKHRSVDDYPYGGGPGMVMKPEPVLECLDSLGEPAPFRILLSPQGELWNQNLALHLSQKTERFALICGRYEGFDERIRIAGADLDISIGDYVLSGGEAAACVVIETMSRHISGVVGDSESVTSDSLGGNLLKHPQYTRPPEYRGLRVPEILLSGDHRKIQKWREEMSIENTKRKRPDLFTCKDDLKGDKKSVCRGSEDPDEF
ncbi:tRNA (guanosine(37)-N1)-methyltransferase TrmD [bacterium]|nr:tRNA (guanosine(37)-N1)-methyltransferase TrmD [candidate division CSSED10-310 bacterium]